MLCDFCHVPLAAGRLFCTGCGEPTPEGRRVMSLDPATVATRLPSEPIARVLRPRPRETSSAAVLSLIFGLLGYVFLPFVGALIAIVTGHWAKKEIKVSAGRVDGDLIATTGLVLGYSQIALASVALVAFVSLAMVSIVAGH
jgi:hypothetical protein